MSENTWGLMQNLSRSQEQRILEMTERAANWDVSMDVHPSVFPTRDIIPTPELTSVRQERQSPLNQRTQVGGRLPTAGENSIASNVAVKSLSHTSVTKAYCSALSGRWYKREFKPKWFAPLVHRDQHCCSTACASFTVLTRDTGGSGGLDTCCQECNAWKCKLVTNTVVRTLVASVSRITSPTKASSTPAVFVFAA